MDEAPLLRRFAHVTEKGMPMKALIPAAGLGTRFLPATKAQPKEMLLVVDRPAIQYVVEEGLASDADEVVIHQQPRERRPNRGHFVAEPGACGAVARPREGWRMPTQWSAWATTT